METININPNSQEIATVAIEEQKCLRKCILEAIDSYFNSVGDSIELDKNTLVVGEVESAMYEGIMRYTRGNQSKAAKVLGVSRGTLRTKLMHYFSTTHVGGIYRV